MPIAPGVAVPLAEIELRATRTSGLGGQHANVTASRVEAVFDVPPRRRSAPSTRRESSSASARVRARWLKRRAARPATARPRSSASGSAWPGRCYRDEGRLRRHFAARSR